MSLKGIVNCDKCGNSIGDKHAPVDCIDYIDAECELCSAPLFNHIDKFLLYAVLLGMKIGIFKQPKVRDKKREIHLNTKEYHE